MITCAKCQESFEGDYRIGYPGHVDSPGSYLHKAGFCGLVAAGFGIAGLFLFRHVLFTLAAAFLIGAMMSLIYLPQARAGCEKSGGGVCPACGHQNEVRWNS